MTELRKIKVKNGKRCFQKRKGRVKKYVLRSLLVFFTLILLVLALVVSVVAKIAHGPSETFRDALVLSAMQASATKWVPGLFLGNEEVERILALSSQVKEEYISLDDYKNNYADSNKPGSSRPGDPGSSNPGGPDDPQTDEWANAINGMKFETIAHPNFKGYVLLVRDPSRVYVGTSSDFTDPKVEGLDIFDLAKKENCIVAINGGEFDDPGGVGTGNTPKGLTYSKGACVWDQSTYKTFIGLTAEHKLVVYKDLTKEKSDEIGIRDGVCFQTTNAENILISNDGKTVTLHRADSNTAVSQRTAIGQREDGTLIFLVTDGRSAESLGATYNDCIDIMVKYGAITAGMLDGGSSSMLYYENFWEYYTQYNYDSLGRYQKKGLINNYKAFTMPRQIPTFFCVAR